MLKNCPKYCLRICLKFAWKLLENCLKIAWKLLENCLTKFLLLLRTSKLYFKKSKTFSTQTAKVKVQFFQNKIQLTESSMQFYILKFKLFAISMSIFIDIKWIYQWLWCSLQGFFQLSIQNQETWNEFFQPTEKESIKQKVFEQSEKKEPYSQTISKGLLSQTHSTTAGIWYTLLWKLLEPWAHTIFFLDLNVWFWKSLKARFFFSQKLEKSRGESWRGAPFQRTIFSKISFWKFSKKISDKFQTKNLKKIENF